MRINFNFPVVFAAGAVVVLIGLLYRGCNPTPKAPAVQAQNVQEVDWSQFEKWVIGKTYKEIVAHYGPTWTDNLDQAGGAQWVHRYKNKNGEIRFTHFWVSWKGAEVDEVKADETGHMRRYINLDKAVAISVVAEDKEGQP